jgi:hypothetical protein
MKKFLNRYLNKENFKKIAGWCVKNRRFFIAAVLFVALLVLLRACTGTDGVKEPETETETGAVQQESEGTESTEFTLDSSFEQDAHEEVNSLIAAYFDAFASADIDALEALASPVSENEKSYIRVFSQYIEGYENIVCYTKAGLDDGSYLVSAYFDMKFYGVETKAPGLDFFYVETADDGSVFINNLYSAYNLNRTENELDPNIYAVILQFEQQEDSVALRTQVEDAYEEAIASDVDLATMLSATIPNAMAEWMDSITEDASGTEADTETDGGDDGTGDTAQEETPADDGNGDAAQEETPADDGAGDTAQEETPADDGAGDTAQEETPADDGTGDTAQEEPAKNVVKVKITANTVNVREEPSTSSDVLGKVEKGETFTELDDLDGWFAISYDGQTGYVNADYVTEVTEEQ